MKTPFVIGGAGFIGSHLVRYLLRDPAITQVVVFDNLSSGSKDRLPADPRVLFIRGNVRDFDHLRVSMEEVSPDAVFHLAANPDIARAIKEPTIDFQQGTVLTNNVLEAMRLASVKRLFYMSGSGVYGDRGESDVSERDPCAPISTYGASKIACEALISAYSYMFDLEATAFRFANVVGPRQTHGVGYDFLRKLRADPTKLLILGDGQQSKSYIHVDDVLDAIFLAAKINAPFEVYNVSTNDSMTVLEIAELAMRALSIDPQGVTIEKTGGRAGWKGDVPVVRFSCGKIRSIGWRCRRNSSEAMRAALDAMVVEMGALVGA